MYRLIIIDDDVDVCSNLANYFPWKETGFQLMERFYDGYAAYQYLLENTVDVIFCDIKMPVMNGLEMAEKLSRMNRDEIIVFVSGYKDFDYARKAMEYGVKYYLLKPVTYQEIKEKLVELTALLRKKYNSDPPRGECISDRRIDRIKNYVRANYRTASLISVAEYTNMNQSYLSRYFKKNAGENLSSYITRVRMQQAIRLLQDERQKNIYTIGEQVGYTNAARFAQAFSKHYGVTPNEYRNDFSKIQIVEDGND